MTLQMFEKFAQTRGGQAYRRVSGAVVHVDDERRQPGAGLIGEQSGQDLGETAVVPQRAAALGGVPTTAEGNPAMTTPTGTQFSDRFAAACAEAVAVHGREFRKGTSVPYLSHPLAVASIAIDFGANEDQAIAALLHDAVEDGGGQEKLDELREEFGAEVARIVEALSDAKPAPGTKKPPWWIRKVDYLDALRKAGLVISALTQREQLTEIIELPKPVHPWYVGVQFHPEFKSTPWQGHPLFKAYIKAALDQQSSGKTLKVVA